MENNTITNKELFYHYAESLGIKTNDAQILMALALSSREEVLPQADVIKSVCEQHGKAVTIGTDGLIRCTYCGHEIKQTVL
jgi:histidinol phosphatase-like PHP family hydrolase